jgi:hypothetical protein
MFDISKELKNMDFWDIMYLLMQNKSTNVPTFVNFVTFDYKMIWYVVKFNDYIGTFIWLWCGLPEVQTG